MGDAAPRRPASGAPSQPRCKRAPSQRPLAAVTAGGCGEQSPGAPEMVTGRDTHLALLKAEGRNPTGYSGLNPSPFPARTTYTS
jgi:hypothetical protein